MHDLKIIEDSCESVVVVDLYAVDRSFRCSETSIGLETSV